MLRRVTEFAAATAARRTAPGCYAVDVSPDWWVFTGPNGGYVASVVLRALTEEVADPARAARSLTVHYLRPAAAGPGEVRVETLRRGRSLTTLSATLLQDGQTVATALAAFALPREALSFDDAVPPPAPAPEDAPRSTWPDELAPPIARRFEYRPVSGESVFQGGDRAEATAWVRLREAAPYEPVLLATVADALVPAVFARAPAPLAAVTVDLTVHFRAPSTRPPAEGWALASFTTAVAADGYCEEDGVVFAEDGTLLAQSRQLAVLLPMG
jgi:acyl-CoA thioesterase